MDSKTADRKYRQIGWDDDADEPGEFAKAPFKPLSREEARAVAAKDSHAVNPWRVIAVQAAVGLGVALVAGIALLVGALAGSRDPLRPLVGLLQAGAPAASATKFERVGSVTELDEKLRAPGRPVMLDFYADWCVSCKEMESFTFSDPRVKARFENLRLLQVDVTANTEAHKLLLKRFSLFGPPGIIFFDAEGREIRGLRVVGYQDADSFLKTLNKLGSE